ncbi:MAG: VWA domain-containing protein [Bacteroidetes bacterium]|nr:VWA domain-containing protein [Fibrella sp.]
MKKLFLLSLLVTLLGCDASKDLGPSSSSGYALSDGTGLAGGGSVSAPGSAPPNAPAPKAGVITAGEWHDLSNWPFWQGLMQKEPWTAQSKAWKLSPTEQYTCLIHSASGQSAADVHVSVRDGQQRVVWEGTTDRTGRVRVVPQLFDRSVVGPFAVYAVMGQQSVRLGTLTDPSGDVTFRLPASVAAPAPVVDVQLVVDATGSMGDEMEYLKNELTDVVEQAQRQLPNTTFRMGSVFYRDHGDDYVTRSLPFTTTLTDVIGFIGEQKAGGGGDFPEAVEEGLQAGINQQWSASARTRLLFLLLDAPPHDKPETIDRMANLVKQAGQKGIRIIPITASGIDKPTEYLMRTMAIGTQSTYVFITNHSGIGNNHLEPTIGEYKVEYLNELMTRLIVQYGKP